MSELETIADVPFAQLPRLNVQPYIPIVPSSRVQLSIFPLTLCHPPSAIRLAFASSVSEITARLADPPILSMDTESA